jgi:hypothetical protein
VSPITVCRPVNRAKGRKARVVNLDPRITADHGPRLRVRPCSSVEHRAYPINDSSIQEPCRAPSPRSIGARPKAARHVRRISPNLPSGYEWCSSGVADCALDCLGGEASGTLDGDFEDIEELEQRRGGHDEQCRVHDVVDTFIVEPRYLAQQ